MNNHNQGRGTLDVYAEDELPLRPLRGGMRNLQLGNSLSTNAVGPVSSCLSPNAKVFVPRTTAAPPPKGRNPSVGSSKDAVEEKKVSSVQNRLNVNYTPDLSQTVSNHSESNQQFSPSGEENNVLSCVAQLVNVLNEDPGVFDSIQKDVVRLFEGFENNQFVLSNVMEIIFDQSIEKQNFRYMGAKLYQLLDSMVPLPNSLFKYLLKLKLNYHQQEISDHNQFSYDKIRGTTLFLAEIFLHLQDNGPRMKEIADNIVSTIYHLLKEPSADNVKCVCFTLKLAGYELEIDCPSEIAKIISALERLPLDTSTQRVFESVLNLRRTRWGRKETRDTAEAIVSDTNHLSDDPVFYGPDGHVLTEEESSFLESNIPYDEKDVEDTDSDPEMNVEMKNAYKDFLKEQQKNS